MIETLVFILRALRTLFGYFVLGLLVGVFFAPMLPFMKKGNMPFRVWYLIDVLVCTVAHNTDGRTLSGWTGQHMSSNRRYKYQAVVIDGLARLFGDDPNHCWRAYVSEMVHRRA